MKSTDVPAPAQRPRKMRSRRVVARRKPPTRDARFVAMLRNKCIRAASVGALSAAGESIPGLGSMLGMVFGELLDAKFLTTIQRELIEETFALYEFELPKKLKSSLVGKLQFLGSGAGITGDVLLRTTLKRTLGRFGGKLIARVLPLTSIVTSATSNAAATYAIGKRAQAVAKLRHAPITGMADLVRAFTGVDERRLVEWTRTALVDSIAAAGKSLSNLVTTSLRRRPATTPQSAAAPPTPRRRSGRRKPR